MMKPIALGVVVASLGMLPLTLNAQQAAKTKTVRMHEMKPGLLAKATVKADDARQKAQAKAPGETIEREIIKQDGSNLVYEFDFKAAGKSGVDEVTVDANSGAVSELTHESAVTESAERAGHKAHTAGDTAWSKTKQGAKKVGKATKTAADTVANRVQ